MTILLKNLMARVPQTRDLTALDELVTLCEGTATAQGENMREELLERWHRPDFQPERDAWVIVTTRGQVVGLGCVWHEAYTTISLLICVHPDYRQRGIGTLLLRMAEERARQFAHAAPSGERVVVRSVVPTNDLGAQSLFTCEGYLRERQFASLNCWMIERNESTHFQPEHQTDLALNNPSLAHTTPLMDHDGLCDLAVYDIYEKELRPARPVNVHTERG